VETIGSQPISFVFEDRSIVSHAKLTLMDHQIGWLDDGLFTVSTFAD